MEVCASLACRPKAAGRGSCSDEIAVAVAKVNRTSGRSPSESRRRCEDVYASAVAGAAAGSAAFAVPLLVLGRR